jgi:hypothetical protein
MKLLHLIKAIVHILTHQANLLEQSDTLIERRDIPQVMDAVREFATASANRPTCSILLLMLSTSLSIVLGS